jgi:hypothetical protein
MVAAPATPAERASLDEGELDPGDAVSVKKNGPSQSKGP